MSKKSEVPNRGLRPAGCVFAISLALLAFGCDQHVDHLVYPPPTTGPSEDTRPRCAPDRPYVVYEHDRLNQADTLETGLYVTHLDSTGSRLVFPGFCSGYDWVPGTDTLVVSTRGRLYLVSVATGIVTVTAITGEAYNASVSPDGRKIAFDADSHGRSALFVLDRATGAIADITPDSMLYQESDWSPEGDELITDGGSIHANGVLRIRYTGAPVRYVVSERYLRSPAWSPRGDRIAWIVAIPSPRVWMADTSGSSRRLVVAGWDGVTWTPDGEGLVYNAPTVSGVRLFHLDLRTGSNRQITF